MRSSLLPFLARVLFLDLVRFGVEAQEEDPMTLLVISALVA